MKNNSKTLTATLILLLFLTAIFITRALSDNGTPSSTSTTGNTSSTTGNNLLCAQVITQARNNQTGEVKSFPTACLPEGWARVAPTPTLQ